jgi:hypothetical protein
MSSGGCAISISLQALDKNLTNLFAAPTLFEVCMSEGIFKIYDFLLSKPIPYDECTLQSFFM